jgi:Holliday junction DNA helicase RuvA
MLCQKIIFCYTQIMFNSLSGTVTGKLPRTVFLDTHGIEWELSASEGTVNAMPTVGETARVYTWLFHREDAMQLFGFATVRERSLFLDLLKVDGVGPKAAQKILSAISPDQLEAALENSDLNRLETVSGIGKKTAQKMILALKGKLTLGEQSAGGHSPAGGNPAAAPWQDVITGLTNMGYDRRDVEGVVLRLVEELPKDLAKSAQEEQLLRRAIVALARR